MSTWMREHRNGATSAGLAKVDTAGLYVAYAGAQDWIVVSELIEGQQSLEVAQAIADRARDTSRAPVRRGWRSPPRKLCLQNDPFHEEPARIVWT